MRRAPDGIPIGVLYLDNRGIFEKTHAQDEGARIRQDVPGVRWQAADEAPLTRCRPRSPGHSANNTERCSRTMLSKITHRHHKERAWMIDNPSVMSLDIGTPLAEKSSHRRSF